MTIFSSIRTIQQILIFWHKRSIKSDTDTASFCPGDRAAEFVHLFIYSQICDTPSLLKSKQTPSSEKKSCVALLYSKSLQSCTALRCVCLKNIPAHLCQSRSPKNLDYWTSNIITGSENTAIRMWLQGKASGASETICRISNIKTDGRWEQENRLNSEFSAAERPEIFYRAQNIAADSKI